MRVLWLVKRERLTTKPEARVTLNASRSPNHKIQFPVFTQYSVLCTVHPFIVPAESVPFYS